METLKERRKQLCLNFALKWRKNPKTKDMFPENSKLHQMVTRNNERFKVNHAYTERYKTSAIFYMLNLLNQIVK